MKMVKIILLIVVLIVAIPLVIALFVDNNYSITREIVINKPRQDVFNYIKFLKNQEKYSKWVMMDPNMKKEYRGTDGTVGFVYAWNGNNQAGEGEQEIKSIQEGEKLDLEIRFKRPFAGVAKTPFITEAVSANQTKVIWGMSGRSKYPLNFTNLFIDNMLGKDIDISLRNLKAILEKQ
jgi:uncharacterized protein YndB with AHSA1/START domain